MDTRIIVLDRINELPQSGMLVGELARNMLRAGSHGDVSIMMLLHVTTKQVIALSLPLPCMEKEVHLLDLHLPILLSRVLASKGHPGASVIFGNMERLDRVGVGRATFGLLDLVAELGIIITIH